jgi:hypothetical protein
LALVYAGKGTILQGIQFHILTSRVAGPLHNGGLAS